MKNEVDRARGQAARPPERELGGALHWQHKRQDKNRLHSRNRSIFFGPEIWAIPTIARRSRARIDLFAFNSLAAWERKRIRFNGDISTVHFISTTEHRITRAILERDHARALNELARYVRTHLLGTGDILLCSHISTS